MLADAALIARVMAAFAAGAVEAKDSETYPMHPSTLAYVFASRWPTQTLCLELRRDLLMQAFTPFAEIVADDAKVERMAGLLANGLR